MAATARRPETLDALVDSYGDAILPIQLDVTDRNGAFDSVKTAAEHFGSLDVVINNAGYGHFGMIEELTEVEVRSQLEAVTEDYDSRLATWNEGQPVSVEAYGA